MVENAMSTLFASFVFPADAERAVAALMDHGMRQEDISVIANEAYGSVRGQAAQDAAQHIEQEGKTGITTTTAADAAMGAAMGGAAGLGVGILAALAAITIPGVGIVVGAGALSTAVAAAAGTTIAGMAAGGVAGYLRDLGMGNEVATEYSNVVAKGGAILAVAVPSNGVDPTLAESILAKYNAVGVSTYYTPETEIGHEATPEHPMVLKEAEVRSEPYVS